MGLHKHGGTMEGALTPICNDCGVSLCWDIEEGEALANEDFWNQWICQDCNGGKPMSLQDWIAQKAQPILMTFFFGADDPLSNWYIKEFTVKSIVFNCNEQLMMFCKAKLFGDEECAQKILLEREPREQKALGRTVRGFDEKIWDEKREHYVYVGSLAKFQQNPLLGDYILATGDTELVEASPYDCIWGVGLSANDPRIHNKKNWRGPNRLGKVQMRVRAKLKSDIRKRLDHSFNEREDGLLHCKVCNGGEGSLPTNCPGTKMPAETDDAVYAGILDFVNGTWVPGKAQAQLFIS